MRNLDIRARVLLAALLPAAVIAVLLASFFVSARFGDLDTALHEQERARARQIAVASEYGVFSGNQQVLQSLADTALAEANTVGVIITGTDGKLLAHSSQRSDILSFLPQSARAGEYWTEIGSLLLYSAPIHAPFLALEDDSLDQGKKLTQERGKVLLAMDRGPLMKKKADLLVTGLGMALLVLAIAGILAMRLSRRVSKPIEDLERAVGRISQGDFQVQVGTEVGGSLARLAESLNRMVAQLALNQEEMHRRIGEATEELRVRKDDAERANVAKSRFLAAASHDLRQPMHALGLFVGQLQQQTVLPEARRLVEQIAESVKALGGLLDGLLDISKLDAGVLTPEKTPFAAAQMLARLESDFSGAAAAKNLFLRIRPSPLWVHTDPVLLERILLNLVANAVRYTEKGGILVACRRRGNRVRIEVRDTGIGIPREAFDSIFQEFVQLRNPGRNRSQGLGLGLAIVKRLATLLDLRLELLSELGKGSIFAVEAPLALPTDAAQAKSSRLLPNLALDGKIVVVVDDDELVLESVASLLESWGCLVLPAAGGKQAEERVRRIGLIPDALLCDFRLQDGEKGTDVARTLRREFGEDIPAILISGDTDPEVLRMAREAGLALLHKPLSSAKLRTLLHRMLGK
ncbi:MAG: ATP-binding protein [Rhodocyclaceae bacterium]|nr:ATP-binding protein [Rhodocyclaceae bacterium]